MLQPSSSFFLNTMFSQILPKKIKIEFYSFVKKFEMISYSLQNFKFMFLSMDRNMGQQGPTSPLKPGACFRKEKGKKKADNGRSIQTQ